MEEYERFVKSVADLPTWWLTEAALTGYALDLQTPLWKGISYSAEEARAYYASLTEEEARAEASEILAAAGWTRSRICFRRS